MVHHSQVPLSANKGLHQGRGVTPYLLGLFMVLLTAYAASAAFFGYDSSAVTKLEYHSVGLSQSVSIFYINISGITIPNSVTTNLFSVKGFAGIADAYGVSAFKESFLVFNTTGTCTPNACIQVIQQYNRSAIPNASNNNEGWYAYNATECPVSYSCTTVQQNITQWVPLSFPLTLPARIKIVQRWKPVLGRVAYDWRINISSSFGDYYPDLAWANTSMTAKRNITYTNGFSGLLGAFPILINISLRNASALNLVNAACSNIGVADDINGQYPIEVPVTSCNATTTQIWTVQNMSGGNTWTGNPAVYMNSSSIIGSDNAQVWKNATIMWHADDFNESRNNWSITTAATGFNAIPSPKAGNDGEAHFGKWMNMTLSNLTIAGPVINTTGVSIHIIWKGPKTNGGDLFSSKVCDINVKSGIWVRTATSNGLQFAWDGGSTQMQNCVPTAQLVADQWMDVWIVRNSTDTCCYNNGTAVGCNSGLVHSAYVGLVGGFTFRDVCTGWQGDPDSTPDGLDEFWVYNYTWQHDEIMAARNNSVIQERLQISILDCQAGGNCASAAVTPNIPPLVTLISPANAAKFTTGTISFQFNASDGDNTTFFGATLWRNATNASYLASIAANFTVTMNISSHPVGNFTWNITVDDGEMGNSTKRTYTVVPANTAPTISLSSPANLTNATTGFINFTYTPADIDNLTVDCTLQRNGTNVSYLSGVSQVLNNFSIVSTPVGDFLWNVTCFDGLLSGVSASRWLTVIPVNGTTPLIYSLASPTSNLSSQSPYVLNWNVSFTTPQVNCSLRFNGTYIDSVNRSTNTTSTNFSLVGAGSISRGVKSWTVNCTDGNGNSNISSSSSFRVNNTRATFSGAFTGASNNTLNFSNNVTFGWSVSDFDNDKLYYTVFGNTTADPTNILSTGTGNSSFTWRNLNEDQKYHWRINLTENYTDDEMGAVSGDREFVVDTWTWVDGRVYQNTTSLSIRSIGGSTYSMAFGKRFVWKNNADYAQVITTNVSIPANAYNLQVLDWSYGNSSHPITGWGNTSNRLDINISVPAGQACNYTYITFNITALNVTDRNFTESSTGTGTGRVSVYQNFSNMLTDYALDDLNMVLDTEDLPNYNQSKTNIEVRWNRNTGAGVGTFARNQTTILNCTAITSGSGIGIQGEGGGSGGGSSNLTISSPGSLNDSTGQLVNSTSNALNIGSGTNNYQLGSITILQDIGASSSYIFSLIYDWSTVGNFGGGNGGGGGGGGGGGSNFITTIGNFSAFPPFVDTTMIVIPGGHDTTVSLKPNRQVTTCIPPPGVTCTLGGEVVLHYTYNGTSLLDTYTGSLTILDAQNDQVTMPVRFRVFNFDYSIPVNGQKIPESLRSKLFFTTDDSGIPTGLRLLSLAGAAIPVTLLLLLLI